MSFPQCQMSSPDILVTTACSLPIIELESDSSSDTDIDMAIQHNQTKPLDNLPQCQESQDTETIDEYTCTIIQPKPRSAFFWLFSRPSSLPALTSRSRSSVNFACLNCFGNSVNFEEDVEILQAQRTQKMYIRVFVTKTKEVHREETWRVPLTQLLYGRNIREQTRVVISRD